jgi:hypothetical protein
MFKMLWAVVTGWAVIVLFGIGHYGSRWNPEPALSGRNELLLGAAISATWVWPALVLALLLRFVPAARRERTPQTAGWVLIAAVPLSYGLLVAVAAMTA